VEGAGLAGPPGLKRLCSAPGVRVHTGIKREKNENEKRRTEKTTGVIRDNPHSRNSHNLHFMGSRTGKPRKRILMCGIPKYSVHIFITVVSLYSKN